MKCPRCQVEMGPPTEPNASGVLRPSDDSGNPFLCCTKCDVIYGTAPARSTAWSRLDEDEPHAHEGQLTLGQPFTRLTVAPGANVERHGVTLGLERHPGLTAALMANITREDTVRFRPTDQPEAWDGRTIIRQVGQDSFEGQIMSYGPSPIPGPGLDITGSVIGGQDSYNFPNTTIGAVSLRVAYRLGITLTQADRSQLAVLQASFAAILERIQAAHRLTAAETSRPPPTPYPGAVTGRVSFDGDLSGPAPQGYGASPDSLRARINRDR